MIVLVLSKAASGNPAPPGVIDKGGLVRHAARVEFRDTASAWSIRKS